ncbi:cupin domain-containing protein [Rivibacter subsaxonicus]|uniref:Putative cupin superfamily protein n=1 Tax=Rivibacter subsaxonicus TaxID=457575 RepID=A0A4V6MER1_9BURK|nr:cupin domain-containing protein [Rivibacter subsaxonicus]RZU02546.1 putative cupin superfamily protein [Rivibacter subsaxonicus]
MSETKTSLYSRLIRNFNEVPLNHAALEPKYECSHARLSEGTAAAKLAVGVNVVAPGKRACPYHLHHAQEEMFIVLEGSGTLRVAGELLPIKAGDTIFIPPGREFPHQIINTSDAPLRYLAIGTTDDPEICEYPDSGKYLAEGGLATKQPFEVIGKAGNSLPYWEGEG